MRDDIFIPEHKTNILPLRWLANYGFHPISMFFFRIWFKANNKFEYDFSEVNTLDYLKEKIGFGLYKLFGYPYEWWGTVYVMDIEGLGIDTSGAAWDDYDDNGIPYWYYFWQEDPITGDAWRLVNKNEE